MLNNYLQKVKFWLSVNKSDLYVATLIFLVGLASFGLGRLSILWPEKKPITIEKFQAESLNTNRFHATGSASLNSKLQNLSSTPNSTRGHYVASKNGRTYHLPWCPGALKIREENKIWFDTKEEAEKAGYKPAGNCEGL